MRRDFAKPKEGDVQMRTTLANAAAENTVSLMEEPLHSFITARIKAEIRYLVKKRKINPQDADDIRQEIFQELVRCIDSFNPENASINTFLSVVIYRTARKAAMNYWANNQDSCLFSPSLDQPKDSSDPDCQDLLGDVVGDDETAMYLGKRERTKHDQELLASEVRSFISSLSNRQKSVCKELMNGKSLKAIAADKKIPRASFYRSVIHPLRNAMKDSGLSEYLTIQKNFSFL